MFQIAAEQTNVVVSPNIIIYVFIMSWIAFSCTSKTRKYSHDLWRNLSIFLNSFYNINRRRPIYIYTKVHYVIKNYI